MVTWEHEIRDPEGLHARPASKLMMQAMKYKSSIQVICNQSIADGKNILELMALGVRRSDIVTIQADGEDEEEALEAVSQTLAKEDDLNL